MVDQRAGKVGELVLVVLPQAGVVERAYPLDDGGGVLDVDLFEDFKKLLVRSRARVCVSQLGRSSVSADCEHALDGLGLGLGLVDDVFQEVCIVGVHGHCVVHLNITVRPFV